MALVSHSKKTVFFKARKTVGINVEMLLGPLCAPSNHVANEKCSAPIFSPPIFDQGLVGALKTSLVQQRETRAFKPAGYPETPSQEL